MISVAWLLICLLWWFACLTFALPLTLALKFSSTARSAFFAWQYASIVGPLCRLITQPARRRAFQFLEECAKDRDKSVPLEIMEIGIGEGANLKYYPENVNLTVLDVNKHFEPYFEQNKKKFPYIHYRRTVIQPAEDMSRVEDSSLDVVISTYVHCSCQDSDAVLKEVKRVLRPGGKYVFLEHVLFPSNELGITVQRLINPIWILFFNGCTLDRDTAPKILRAGFTDTICEKFIEMNWLMFLNKHQIVGVATK